MKFRFFILGLLLSLLVSTVVAVYPSIPSSDSGGMLYVASYPTGATILINGTDYGTTDTIVSNVPAGIRNLTLVKAGYLPYTTTVTVPPGDVKILAPVSLVKGGSGPGGTGTLYVASYPTNATILINGTDYGMTNRFVNNVPSGLQNLTLTKPGYEPKTVSVEVPPGGLKVLAPIELTLSTSPSPMPGMPEPSGYGNIESVENARGIYYNGQLYIFSLWYKGAELWNKNNYGIQLRYFKNNALSTSYGMWGGKSEAEPTPVVVRAPNGTEMLFIFVTGQNGNIYFTRVNGSSWIDDDWVRIRDSETGAYISTAEEGWEVAPVYDSRYHRLYVYYARNYKDYLNVAVTNDFGNTWLNYPVENSPKVYSPPGAVNFYDDVLHTDTLLAVKDTDSTIRICHMIEDDVLRSEALPTPSSDNIYGYGRPFLIDTGQNIALMYAAEHGNQAYCSPWYIPHIVVFNKTTQLWGEPYQAFYLPDLGTAQGTYQFHWQPNAAFDTGSNTFYLFYGYEPCNMYTDETNDGPFWMFAPIRIPGT